MFCLNIFWVSFEYLPFWWMFLFYVKHKCNKDIYLECTWTQSPVYSQIPHSHQRDHLQNIRMRIRKRDLLTLVFCLGGTWPIIFDPMVFLWKTNSFLQKQNWGTWPIIFDPMVFLWKTNSFLQKQNWRNMTFLTNFHYFRQPTDHPDHGQNGHNINTHFDIKLLSGAPRNNTSWTVRKLLWCGVSRHNESTLELWNRKV